MISVHLIHLNTSLEAKYVVISKMHISDPATMWIFLLNTQVKCLQNSCMKVGLLLFTSSTCCANSLKEIHILQPL